MIIYNKIIGGVHPSDQNAGLYDFNRKPQKWWKKVFYKHLTVAVTNLWIIYNEHKNIKLSLKEFGVPLALNMILEGRKGGRKLIFSTENHGNPRCCLRCTSLRQERRTKMKCSDCNTSLFSHALHIFTNYGNKYVIKIKK